jgi:hypothetical protein
MIKTVQVEEKRCICDICNNKHYTMHGPTDTDREGWIHATDFAATGRDLDICPTCVDFLRSLFKEPGSGKDGEC